MAYEANSALPRTGTISRVSWGAVFAGTVIAAIAQVTLLLMGMAIGLFSLGGGDGGVMAYGIGAYIWWLISGIASLFLGGWVTSRFAGLQRTFDGVLHGLVTWSLATILGLYFLTSVVGGVLGGAFSVMGDVVSGAGQAISAVAPELAQAATGGDPIESVIGEGREVLEEVRQEGGEEAVTEVTTAVREIFQDGEISQAEQQRVVGLLTQYTAMTQQEATGTVNEWADMYAQAREQVAQVVEQAGDVAEDVADALAAAALWAFLTLLLGAGAAALGGSVGRVKGDVRV